MHRITGFDFPRIDRGRTGQSAFEHIVDAPLFDRNAAHPAGRISAGALTSLSAADNAAIGGDPQQNGSGPRRGHELIRLELMPHMLDRALLQSFGAGQEAA